MSERSDCRSCHAPMIWATTVPKDEGAQSKRIPLDPEPVDPRENKGAVACIEVDGHIETYGRTALAELIAADHDLTYAEARAFILDQYVWRNAHFATCEFADVHRTVRS